MLSQLSLLLTLPLASTFVIPGLSFTPSSSGISKRASSAILAGDATYYGGNVAGGACSFSTYTLPNNIFGTALSSSNWDDSAECGACVEVTGPSGNSIIAMIVDECPGCGTNHLDLFPTAFTSLASASTGIISVSWTYTTCPITTPLELLNKSGVSAYWFAMQVVNANEPVASLEVSTDGGSTWQATTRSTYNFFENQSGFGSTSVDVRVTSAGGQVLVVEGVEVVSGGSVTASENFGGGSSGAVATSVAASSVESSTSAEAIASSTTAAAQVTTAEATETSTTIQTSTIASAATSSTPSAVMKTMSVVPIAATSSTEAAAATSTTNASKTTSTIYVTVTASGAGASSVNDFCYV